MCSELTQMNCGSQCIELSTDMEPETAAERLPTELYPLFHVRS